MARLLNDVNRNPVTFTKQFNNIIHPVNRAQDINKIAEKDLKFCPVYPIRYPEWAIYDVDGQPSYQDLTVIMPKQFMKCFG